VGRGEKQVERTTGKGRPWEMRAEGVNIKEQRQREEVEMREEGVRLPNGVETGAEEGILLTQHDAEDNKDRRIQSDFSSLFR
jgi:hypothetical protein